MELVLRPMQVLRRFGHSSDPYIVELYVVVDQALLYAPMNITFVVVQLEIWSFDRIPVNVPEYHLLSSLGRFKRIHAIKRHDCLHALLLVSLFFL
ncbi:hypothetical protein Ciccas_007471 [Cichlidogyrus casuarinus]|uniref:Peptidase M12B domain-containing protein n=1 Tax=Cichlidogyrus casuarinus TaxID=1844966 RepID=A0ABD2Q2T9_9PLAT